MVYNNCCMVENVKITLLTYNSILLEFNVKPLYLVY
jgi:hypothetical protein